MQHTDPSAHVPDVKREKEDVWNDSWIVREGSCHISFFFVDVEEESSMFRIESFIHARWTRFMCTYVRVNDLASHPTRCGCICLDSKPESATS